jgi:hypothetical protein
MAIANKKQMQCAIVKSDLLFGWSGGSEASSAINLSTMCGGKGNG